MSYLTNLFINDKKNVAVICNGEIYNYKDLYKKHKLNPQTNSDCEVILQLYLKHGIDFTLKKLDGVFAFILVDFRDPDKHVCYISRDTFGVRPLYTNTLLDDNMLFYSSELKQISNLVSNNSIRQFEPGNLPYSKIRWKIMGHRFCNLL